MKGKFRNLLVTGGATLALLVTMQPLAPVSAGPNTQANCQNFQQTGKKLCGRFLTYWQEHGGLMQQGYPISNEFTETSGIDGKEYKVQYFERAVFELHPELKAPNDVLLSLLGTLEYRQRYANNPPQELPPDANPVAGVTFPETGKTLKGVFLDYWRNHGGLAQQGYPITNLIKERSRLNGQEYTVQYFERAVFEMHPENPQPFNVLLAQLGTFRYATKYPNGEPGPGPSPNSALSAGLWGGTHLSFKVEPDGSVTLDFDCAHGSIPGPVRVDNGRIDVMGTFTYEHGGPTSEGQPADTHPARYTGTVSGNVLTLTVAVTDQKDDIGSFTVGLGKQPLLRKCL